MTSYEQKQLRKSIYIPKCCRGEISNYEAARKIGIAKVNVLKLKKRYREKGDLAFIRANKGHPPYNLKYDKAYEAYMKTGKAVCKDEKIHGLMCRKGCREAAAGHLCMPAGPQCPRVMPQLESIHGYPAGYLQETEEMYMARIAGVDLPREKRVEIGLTYIFGIGRTTSGRILEKANVNPDTRVRDLTDEEVDKIRAAMEELDIMVEGDLRRDVAMNIKRLQEIGCYRGIRHRKGLPVRGQKTKTNARTRKGPRRTVANKKK